ncbi:unnamed protein product [Miscanthus lutarioriparius]|uniref:F-box domain-containing protein n=1 Tax=Miscanthus lutarioriparius TaxID=422564 RepID=A0A811SLF1_9POAL|nr:unnamed protein product [Miscanthus lutarioriparius]
MTPVRRARHADPTGSPYPDGWLSYRHRRRRLVEGNVRAKSDVSGGATPSPTTLPDDVLFGIFSRVSGFTDAARCAATCRRWARVVATRAAPICRALPPPPPGGFLPHLAIGAFLQHQENDGASRRRRARGGEPAQLRFVPTAFASRLLGPFAGLLGEGGASFDNARPVASRNGRVVLQLGREARADGLTLCVWNPMTGDVAMVPTLSGKEFPGTTTHARYSPAMTSLTTWGPECKKPGAKISGHVLRQLGPAVVLHGVAYWPMHRAAFGVRLGSTAAVAAATMDVCSVPYRYRLTNWKPDEYVLGVSTDGRLNFVDIGIIGGRGVPIICFSTSLLEDAVGYKSTTTSVDRSDEDISIDLPQIKATRTTPMKPWWFGEKSGTLIFTVEETSSTSAVFALNVATRSLEKLADGVSNHTCCRRLYGYEMDRAALLASEITGIKQQMEARWLVLGDFNMIYGVEDKNNQLVNFRMLNRFKNTIDNLQLAPLALHGRRFTWCNEQQDPTMTKIDHFLASAEWLEIFPRTDLQAMASLGSDHCPLFLQGDISFDFSWGFRFEAHWVNIPGFF